MRNISNLSLIDDLLALDDAELDQKIADIGTQLWRGRETTPLQQWVVDRGYLTKVPQEYTWGDPAREGSWDYGKFSVDLLFMTHRWSDDFPEWTPEKF